MEMFHPSRTKEELSHPQASKEYSHYLAQTPINNLVHDIQAHKEHLNLIEAQRDIIELLVNPETRQDIDEEFIQGFLQHYEIHDEDALFNDYLTKDIRELQEQHKQLEGEAEEIKLNIEHTDLEVELLRTKRKISLLEAQDGKENEILYTELLHEQQTLQVEFLRSSIQMEVKNIYLDIEEKEEAMRKHTQKRNKLREQINKHKRAVHKNPSKEQRNTYDIKASLLNEKIQSHETRIRQSQEQIHHFKQALTTLSQKEKDTLFIDELQSQLFVILEFIESFQDHLVAGTPLVTKEDIIVQRYSPFIESLQLHITNLITYIQQILPGYITQVTSHPREPLSFLSLGDKHSFITSLEESKNILEELYESLYEASWIPEEMSFMKETPPILHEHITTLIDTLRKDVNHIFPSR